eukprot:TRINITY_DN67990_c7_g4_i1.p1 TRINITY_DN67990_c7_g4~~TRINITY_DN67990_c7_g4_i1.p1  ORF type:complete len:226 (-),score=13.91 TRINITY_DN67990_c7_g4_i1:144-821(-)
MSLLFSLASVVDLTKWNELNMQSWVDMLEPFGYPVDDKFFADHLCEQTDGEILQGLMPMTTAMEFDSLQNTRQKFLEEQIPRLEFTPVPGVVDLLHDARQNSASPYTAYIMTNIGNESIRDTILSKAGLQNMFDGCFQYGSRTSMVHETVEQLKQQRDGNIATPVIIFQHTPTNITKQKAISVGKCTTVGVACSGADNSHKLLAAGAKCSIPNYSNLKAEYLVHL